MTLPMSQLLYMVVLNSLLFNFKGIRSMSYHQKWVQQQRYANCTCTSPSPLLLARLNFVTDKGCFKINDNPLIEELQSRSVAVKQLFDYLRTEEYRL